MTVLIAHHLQELWDETSEADFGTNCENQAGNIINYIKHVRTDVEKIIVTMHEPQDYVGFNEVDNYGELPPKAEISHAELVLYCEENNIDVEFKDYGYTWTREPEVHDVLCRELSENGFRSKLDEDEINVILSHRTLDGDEIIDTLPESIISKLDDEDLNVLGNYTFEYEQYPIEEFKDTWVHGTRSHYTEENVIAIHEWQKDLLGEEVLLCGAFEGECILDIETVLDHLGVNYSKVSELTLGTGEEYEFIGVNERSVENRVNEVADELGDMLEQLFDMSSHDVVEEYFKSDEFAVDVEPTNVAELVKELVELSGNCGELDLEDLIIDNVYIAEADIHEMLTSIVNGDVPDHLDFTGTSQTCDNGFDDKLLAAVKIESQKKVEPINDTNTKKSIASSIRM